MSKWPSYQNFNPKFPILLRLFLVWKKYLEFCVYNSGCHLSLRIAFDFWKFKSGFYSTYSIHFDTNLILAGSQWISDYHAKLINVSKKERLASGFPAKLIHTHLLASNCSLRKSVNLGHRSTKSRLIFDCFWKFQNIFGEFRKCENSEHFGICKEKDIDFSRLQPVWFISNYSRLQPTYIPFGQGRLPRRVGQ